MNIFILDDDLVKSASYMVDRHIVKMPTESLQMLMTNMILHDSEMYRDDYPLTKAGTQYKISHKNHPCTQWAGENISNFRWLLDYAEIMCREYTARYKKIHYASLGMAWIRSKLSTHSSLYRFPFSQATMTPFALCMPDDCKSPDGNAVLSYRNYYLREKSHLFKWRNYTPRFVLDNASSITYNDGIISAYVDANMVSTFLSRGIT
jgi:hypothetical protein